MGAPGGPWEINGSPWTPMVTYGRPMDAPKRPMGPYRRLMDAHGSQWCTIKAHGKAMGRMDEAQETHD